MHFSKAIQVLLALATAVSGNDFYARNLRTIQSIYNLTVFPNNVPIRTNGSVAVPPGLFSANASGRVTPLGNFTGFDDSIEYFFALALVPSPPLYAVFSAADIVSFQSGCANVAASVAYLRTSVLNSSLPNNGQYINSLKQIAFWRFDEEGAVLSYDAWIPNLSVWTNALAAGQQDFSNPAVRTAYIQQLCGGIQALCVGENVQYASVDECASILGNRTFGTYDEVWGDNVVCRTIHLGLVPLRPDVHCPHTGPTGGMKCVDEPYDDAYFGSDELLFGRPEGETFFCPPKY